MSGRGRTLRGYLGVLAGSAGARGASFVGAVVVARELGPGGFGDFALFAAVMVVFGTATDFVNITYVRFATARDSQPRVLLRAAFFAQLAFTGFLTLAAVPVGRALADLVLQRPDLRFEMAAAVATGSWLGLISLYASTFQAQRRFLGFGILSGAFYVASLVILLILVALSVPLTTTTTISIFLVCALVMAAISGVLIWRSVRRQRVDSGVLAPTLSFAKWLFAANVVLIVGQRLDVLLVGRYVAPDDVGFYGAAVRLGVVGTLLVGALVGILLPRVAGTLESRTALASYVRESVPFSLGIAAIITGLWVFAPQLISLLFGEAYVESAGLARIVLLGTLLTCIAAPFAELFLAQEVPRQIVTLGVGRIVVILGLIPFLIPRLGVSGAAWSYVAAEFFVLLYSVSFVVRRWRRLEDGAASAVPPTGEMTVLPVSRAVDPDL